MHLVCRIRGEAGLQELLGLFMEKGADLNYPNASGMTPLHEAVMYGEVATVKLLLKKKAFVNSAGAAGVTPLHCAIQ